MTFLSLIAALLIEQLRPLRPGNIVHLLYTRYAARLEGQCNGGKVEHGIVAWALAVLPLVAAAYGIYLLLHSVSPVLAWVWNIAVLYVTMGFRQFSHPYTRILQALQESRLDDARACLGEWRGEPVVELTGSEIARVAIEKGLLSAHRHVFGPVAGFIVLGPAGAVLYRTAAMLSDRWGGRTDPEFGAFGRFAERFFFWLDWLPTRATAASFAIVGNFEDAVYCWLTQGQSWTIHSQGVILSSGGGAIGVRLGDGIDRQGARLRPELGMGEEADVDYMRSTVGLIWRALILWMVLLLLVTVAYALG
ncbi:MAG TPA: CobD/CbiB family protein [Burkholderiales bacterium]|nr:CobD/CbiB family protein [Burkholderiales bacterium]